MAHVGDSRAYVYRDNELQQMTKDHTFVQSLVDSGEITQDQASVHPRRNLMMRAIDGIHAVEVDLSVRETRVGDRFLLCSDGLCGVIDHAVISECIAAEDLTNAVTLLIDAAMAAGAPDNITVVVADVVDDELLVDPVLIGSAADSVNQQRLPAVDFPEEGEASVEREWDFEIPKFRIRRLLIPVLSTLGILALIAAGAIFWISSQWYVGVYAPTNSVAIYQGVASGGLSRLVEVSALNVGELPDFERTQVVATIDSGTHGDAQAAVARLQARADMCKGTPSTPGCPVVNQ
jgi:protein phosphatase